MACRAGDCALVGGDAVSKIEREMIAEARAAREAQQRQKEAEDIGADIPSAPNDEQIEHAWQYAHIMGHIPHGTGCDG